VCVCVCVCVCVPGDGPGAEEQPSSGTTTSLMGKVGVDPVPPGAAPPLLCYGITSCYICITMLCYSITLTQALLAAMSPRQELHEITPYLIGFNPML